MNITDLPNEILSEVFSYLPDDTFTLSKVRNHELQKFKFLLTFIFYNFSNCGLTQRTK